MNFSKLSFMACLAVFCIYTVAGCTINNYSPPPPTKTGGQPAVAEKSIAPAEPPATTATPNPPVETVPAETTQTVAAPIVPTTRETIQQTPVRQKTPVSAPEPQAIAPAPLQPEQTAALQPEQTAALQPKKRILPTDPAGFLLFENKQIMTTPEATTSASIRGDKPPVTGTTQTTEPVSPDSLTLAQALDQYNTHPDVVRTHSIMQKLIHRIEEIDNAKPNADKKLAETWSPYLKEIEDKLIPINQEGLVLLKNVLPKKKEVMEIHTASRQALETMELGLNDWSAGIRAKQSDLLDRAFARFKKAKLLYTHGFEKNMALQSGKLSRN